MKKRRVNLTLPEDLWERLRDRVPRRQMSQYVAAATEARLAQENREILRSKLKDQCLAQAERDLSIAADFFLSEQEALEQAANDEGVAPD